jgi:acyl-CoA thioester hydrolase
MAIPEQDREPLRSLADRARFVAWTTDKLRLADVDHQGHVNNAVHAVLYTNGRHEFIQRHLRAYVAKTDPFAMVKTTIEYLKEMHYPGEVEIGTLIRRVGRSSITFGQGMFNDGRCIAVSETIMVLVDAATRRAKPLPPEAVTQLARFVDAADKSLIQ